MKSFDSEAAISLATRLARAAGKLARETAGSAKIDRKADDSVVTDADHAMQELIIRGITEAYPDHAVIAEEQNPVLDQPLDPAQTEFCWIIDPLDGSRNFAAGFPCFATSIAVLRRGNPIVGVVMEHHLQRVYAAIKGEGAWCNDERLDISGSPRLRDHLVGVPSSKDRLTVQVVEHWTRTRGLVIRNVGSAAFQLALVAGGALSAAFCRRCKIWDIAAGLLIVEEAGGIVTDPFGVPVLPFDLAADPDDNIPSLGAHRDVHEQMVASIRDATVS